MKGQLLRYPPPGWAAPAHAAVFPGAHVLCFGQNRHALEAEEAGFEVRDAIEVIGPVRHRVWLLRRPVLEKNVVSQVLKTGTGALWIDGCRIYTDWDEADRPESWKRSGYTAKPDAEKIAAPPGQGITLHPKGRWPPNLLLVHTPGCQRAGTRRVPATSISATTTLTAVRRSGAHAEAGGHQTVGRVQPVTGYANEDGLETVEAWACAPDCPAAKLDEQSGELSGRGNKGISTGGGGMYGHAVVEMDQGALTYDQGGGASRFFPQFANEEELDAWLLRLIFGPRNA